MNKIKLILASLLLLVSVFLSAQTKEQPSPFRLDKKKSARTKSTRLTLTNPETLKLESDSPIDGLAMTGKVILPKTNSYVRILLEDKDGREYVVLETCKLYNDVDTVVLSDYCEETKILSDVYPSQLHVYLSNASVEIKNLTFNNSDIVAKDNPDERKARLSEMARYNRMSQSQIIVSRINENNKKNRRLWRASVTEVSLMPWESRKRVLGIDENCMPTGFEYYSSGIIELGEPTTGIRSQSSSTSPYVESFDWRKRHGKNWMTKVRNQGHGNGCWAFAAIGVTEALVNLYFNKQLDLDLSEQEVISCSRCGSNTQGGNTSLALGWISSYGVSEDSCFRFSDSDEPCENKRVPNDTIFMSGTFRIYNQNSDSIKKALINYGPSASGIYYIRNDTIRGHAMVLTGYSTIHAGDTINYYNYLNQELNEFDTIPCGDSRIGQTYWIFKNSYGTDSLSYEHQGYAYVFLNGLNYMISPCYAKTPVRSSIYHDSDIAITDADGDGYYFWGINVNKPAHCPSWVPDTPDGDDSNINYGPMDEYGHLASLPDGITIKTEVPYETDSTTTKRIGIVENGILTITGTTTLSGDAKIRVCEGGTLIVDGGTLNNAKIELVPGSHLIVRNNGTINMAAGEDFEAPMGAVVDVESGSIN